MSEYIPSDFEIAGRVIDEIVQKKDKFSLDYVLKEISDANGGIFRTAPGVTITDDLKRLVEWGCLEYTPGVREYTVINRKRLYNRFAE